MDPGKTTGGRGRAEGRTATRARTRCGCFLPDLTGLARSPSAPTFRRRYRAWRGQRQPRRAGLRSLVMDNTTNEPTITKVEARQGDRKTLNRNVLVWSVALVVLGLVAAYFLA